MPDLGPTADPRRSWRLSVPRSFFERASELQCAADEHAASLIENSMTFRSLAHEGQLWDRARETLHQIESAVESVPIVGSIWAALDANNEAFFVGHNQAHLYAEFIGPVRLPLTMRSISDAWRL